MAASIAPASAVAQPNTPATASEALKQYNELSEQASKLNEELLQAEEKQGQNQEELDKATADVAAAAQVGDQAKADEETFRQQVDKFTEASFEGARFNQLSALLVSDSQQDFLNRMSALGVLASDNFEALDKLSGAVEQASDATKKATEAQARAKSANDEAIKITEDIKKRAADLDTQKKDVKAALTKLSGSEKKTLTDSGDMSDIAVPSGAAGMAVAFALSKRGDMYSYGATGPDVWDCSGLVMMAYRSANVNLPRTSQGQGSAGRAVSRGEVTAGDIIAYNGFGHVALAISNTEVVHASTDGVPVKIVPLDAPGSISAMRRVAG
ncbi:NlpC/P60 family protein [Umezawaea endophytica]|uniref:NlpC/P60 family protein n=1 Tax=Umezawaea endophytica TaxID=1654476 RepID=A0A9X2VH05_9PSEU|nr:NlpC/P60 family protein [Umezawaea endophytica]MCS7476510.1 NlpC/P60 family protein [Umezawaea endophytica]